MFDTLIAYSLRGRLLVLMALVGVMAYGLYAYQRMPVDAFPDISPVMVPVFAEAHGMAPEEVERLITYPIEAAMNGLPKVRQIKSTSAFGMAVVYVYFEDDVDIYFARQLVAERLTEAINDLPPMHDPPTLGPISTGLGQVFLYYLTLDEGADTGGKAPQAYLREVNDWLVKFQLQTVPGVTDILSIGGYVLQYQIRVDPRALHKYDLDLGRLVEAVRANNRNVGGQFLLIGAEEYLVRGLGLLGALEDIARIPLKTVDGVPIILADVADITYGNQIRRGVVTRNGQGEVVSGIVLKLYGENTSKVIENLYTKIEQVRRLLPPGVQLHPYYEQAELVQRATHTVKQALAIGALLVTATLAVFLGNLRTALIVIITLPFCALTAIIFMGWQGLSANLMSLGGIAIAIGMLGDGAIVMVENIHRHLSDPANRRRPRQDVIAQAAGEVARPVVFSIAIIVMVFLPLFTLEGVEGKMFSPMAFTIAFALAGSILAALMVSPALASYLLRTGSTGSLRLTQWLRGAYRPLLQFALHRKHLVLALALAAFLAAVAAVPFLGTEFVPTLEEGSILIGVTMAPSTSLEKGTATVLAMERQIMKYPQVRQILSRIGRPEAGSHPHPVNYAEIHIELHPLDRWQHLKSKAELVEALAKDLAAFPGVQLNFTQPIQNAFDELLSGARAQLAIKLYGEDLKVLRDTARQISAAIEDVPGLVDLAVEQNHGQPQVQVALDRQACARYGITADQVLELVELAVGGQVIDTIYLGTRRYGIHLRYQEPYRRDTQAISNLLVPTGGGALIRLSQVASVTKAFGPIQINREKNQRRWIVQANVRGRDLGSVVADVRRRIADRVTLPPGYFVEYGGQFENQQRAMRRLAIIVPTVILVVFVLLYIAFGMLRHAVMILLNIPLALIGGIAGLLVSGQYLSVPASVGFIALFGIAVQNGMVMVSYFNQLLARGMNLEEAVENGALLRLRPVLMTAVTTILGLLPLLLSSGIGAEVQRPLATVVVFGLASSTALTLLVLPAMYVAVEQRRRRPGETKVPAGS